MAIHAARQALKANPTTIFESNPLERTRYDALKAELLEQMRPEGQLELLTFERYVFATFQSSRAHQHEIEAQDRWLNEPDREIWFYQMERIQKLAALQERRADKALSELRRLQRDRFSALDVANELYLLDQFLPIPATLPVSEIRRTKQSQTSPTTIAMQVMANTQESRDILSGKAKPKPVEKISLTTEEMLLLQMQNRQ
jgi:hypothetical protein